MAIIDQRDTIMSTGQRVQQRMTYPDGVERPSASADS